MKFIYFKFENFKGIDSQIIDLSKNTESQVFTLVGLNESGKTTILEAINYFVYKKEKLNVLELDNYEISDIHDLIPINKRDNFNGKIVIEAGLEFESEDIAEIRKVFRENKIFLTKSPKIISFSQTYFFENSEFKKEKSLRNWGYDFIGTTDKGRKEKKLNNTQARLVNEIIKERIPSILYFPNFLFEFPERIYLDESVDDPKYKFYQIIIQDVLDSLDNDTNISDHLIKRIVSDEGNDKRNLNSLLGKMQKKLSEVIFTKWNQIFNKEISKSEIVLETGKDLKGSYIEFNIKDDVDTYRIVERSLGFRWFFVYILLTQFRGFRKKNNNALFLFDEPASNLHPSAQVELLKSFEKLPRVIYTTHSHYLINPKWLENTFVIKNEAIDYDDEIKYNAKNTNIIINRYREFAVKYPNQTNYFQPILEVLDYKPSSLELVPDVVFTEGKNDFYTLNYIQKIILNYQENECLKFIPGTSASNLETLISLYLGWGRNFLILLDSDDEGIKQKERYIKNFGHSVLNSIFTYEDVNSCFGKIGMEKLFTETDKLTIQKKYYPSEQQFKKKVFNSSIQELHLNSQKIDLEDITIDNFKLVLSFLKEKQKLSKVI